MLKLNIFSKYHRVPLPPGFGAVSNPVLGTGRKENKEAASALIVQCEENLKRTGKSLRDIGEVYVVYPAKHPDVKTCGDKSFVSDLIEMGLQEVRPDVHWHFMHSICEKLVLTRAYNQSSLFALTRRQDFIEAPELDMQENGDIPDFIGKRYDGVHFIVIDNSLEQGTTFADLYSYIRNKGGEVIGMFAYGHNRDRFNDSLRIGNTTSFIPLSQKNTRRTEIKSALEEVANTDNMFRGDASTVLSKFNSRLLKSRSSLDALTDREVMRLLETLNENHPERENFLREFLI